MQHRKIKGMRREIDTKDIFQEVEPHVRFPPKFLWNKSFLRKFIGFIGIQSFVLRVFKGKFPIFVLGVKGGLSYATFELFIFFIHFAKLYVRFEIYQFCPPSVVAHGTAMGHDGWRSNRRGPQQLGQRSRAQRPGRPTAVAHGG
jgi:hypothetical protein